MGRRLAANRFISKIATGIFHAYGEEDLQSCLQLFPSQTLNTYYFAWLMCRCQRDIACTYALCVYVNMHAQHVYVQWLYARIHIFRASASQPQSRTLILSLTFFSIIPLIGMQLTDFSNKAACMYVCCIQVCQHMRMDVYIHACIHMYIKLSGVHHRLEEISIKSCIIACTYRLRVHFWLIYLRRYLTNYRYLLKLWWRDFRMYVIAYLLIYVCMHNSESEYMYVCILVVRLCM